MCTAGINTSLAKKTTYGEECETTRCQKHHIIHHIISMTNIMEYAVDCTATLENPFMAELLMLTHHSHIEALSQSETPSREEPRELK